MKASFVFSLALFCFVHTSYSQDSMSWDTLNVHYRLIHTDYEQYENIIKIKVPPYLTTREVMEQIKLAVQWPGDPPPKKKTTVYVFKEDAHEGEISKTGGVYLPNKGFKWDLRDWRQDTSIRNYSPSDGDKLIYNTLLDSMFAYGLFEAGLETREHPVKKNVAAEFNITPTELDSIYYRVKWWLSLQQYLWQKNNRMREP